MRRTAATRMGLRLATAIALAACLACALWPGLAPASPKPAPTVVPVSLTSASLAVPRSYFGLGVESNELPVYEAQPVLFDRFISLVHPQDGSQMLLRVGGKSADDGYWKTTPTNTPHWVFELGDDWLSQLAVLVRRDHFGVMLDLNLAVHSPTMATSFAQAAVNALSQRHLKGLAIGNEPDLYHMQPGLERERTSTTLPSTPSDWAQNYTPDTYRSDYMTYARALTRAVPGVPLDGPDTTSSSPPWVAAVASLGSLGPSQIDMHRYPYSSCYPPWSPFYPTVPGMLTQAASGGLAVRLHRAQQIAQSHGLPLRITELNSMSCGGPAHVANSFVTALWAPDALFELMKAGIVGVNWHIRPGLRNAPFHLGPNGFKAEPELYGLAMFADMIGSRARLIAAQTPASMSEMLKVWAVRSRKGLRVLLINKGRTPLRVRLARGTGWAATAKVVSLKAPGLRAETGVTLAGQTLGPDARWQGHRVVDKVRARRGAYRLPLPGYSAELLDLGGG